MLTSGELRQLRMYIGLTQEDIAQASGFRLSKISQTERGICPMTDIFHQGYLSAIRSIAGDDKVDKWLKSRGKDDGNDGADAISASAGIIAAGMVIRVLLGITQHDAATAIDLPEEVLRDAEAGKAVLTKHEAGALLAWYADSLAFGDGKTAGGSKQMTLGL